MTNYPTDILINGKRIPIRTDFRVILELFETKSDDELETLISKSMLLFMPISGDADDASVELLKMIIANPQEVFEQVHWFITCGKPAETQKKQLIDFTKDWDKILSAFRRDYAIDLETAELHWWKFIDLLMGLNKENSIIQAIIYRAVDLGKIPDKDERKRAAELKKIYALEGSQDRASAKDMKQYLKEISIG